jgi:type IV secretory pathway VirB4 component
LGRKILSLIGFLRLVLGEVTANEVAVLDRALNATYKLKGITSNIFNQANKEERAKMEAPLMEDLYKILIGMEDTQAQSLAIRLERFIKGSLAGIFSHPSNVNIKNQLTVFSVRELPDQLRPLAMYLILDYIWTKIRREMKKRILVVDEAWYMMKFPDSAAFLVEMVKRSRKYYLGVTTISQDVEDFLGQDRGKEIISNSAMQVLLKQAPVSIEKIGNVFNLSQGEKRLLTTAGVGQGLFFAGNVHIAMSIVASDEEHALITTNPREIMERKEKEGEKSVS